ncbi:hypothetical protein CCAN11_2480033 [Capnocytophaga canimorsus]|uniref:Uncharacterized protein n=1 Tax=Capnocytophaga canimorsus TaxID=28188 RepID=A0A0B7IL49_9FLAO|nr:hypothetical protein CCAN11_2480033 [Capnocytophaga canimorsus]
MQNRIAVNLSASINKNSYETKRIKEFGLDLYHLLFAFGNHWVDYYLLYYRY